MCYDIIWLKIKEINLVILHKNSVRRNVENGGYNVDALFDFISILGMHYPKALVKITQLLIARSIGRIESIS